MAYSQDTAPGGHSDPATSEDGEPRVPGYEIIGELGHGGMGVVYKARQVALQRIVALKMLSAVNRGSSDFTARFRGEAAAAARLQHANIVQLYEYGEAGGRPYFSLEYVAGGSLDYRLRSRPLPAEKAAELLATLAAAMHFAHAHGVIHRDLKPANILIAAEPTPIADARGDFSGLRGDTLKIADFGLAKLLDSDSQQTSTGVILGTPSYMSPEQASGRTHHIGVATDIYSLGAILYECLVGHPPFRGATPFETVLQVTHDDPVPLRRLRPDLPRDLETICMKCLAKEPTKRYSSAQTMADDLLRFLNREPILARPASLWERSRLWVRRHPAKAVMYASLLAAAALFTGLAIRHNTVLTAAYKQTQFEHQEARRQLMRLTIANGTKLADDGDYLWALPWFAEALRLEDNPERIDVDRIRMAAILDLSPTLEQVWSGDVPVIDAVASPDGTMVATVRGDGSVRLWRRDRPGEPAVMLRSPQPGPREPVTTRTRTALQFDRGGRRLLAQLSDGGRVFEIGNEGAPFAVGQGLPAWLPDGRLIVAEPNRLTIRAADSLSPTTSAESAGAPIVAMAVSADGRQVATGHANGEVRLWNVADLKADGTALQITGGPVVRLQFSLDGRRLLAVAGAAAEVWDLEMRRIAFSPLRHAQAITDAAFSPDGRFIATSSLDDTARLWRAEDGQAVADPLKHSSDVLRVAFSPDSRLLATCGDDNLVRVWNARTGASHSPPLPHSGSATAVAFGPDSRSLVTAGEDGLVKLWRVGSPNDKRSEDLVLSKPPNRVPIGDGRHLLISSHAGEYQGAPGEYRAYDTVEKRWLTPGIVHPEGVLAVAVSPDGKWVVTAGADRTARVWDWRTGREVSPPLEHGSRVVDVAFSHDGRSVATASEDNSARVWRASDGQPLTPPLWHNGSVRRIRFSPDGRFVLTAGKGDLAYVWDVATGDEVAPVRRLKPWVAGALASPTGTEPWVLPADQRSVEELIRLAQRLSGHRVDANGTLMPLSAKDY